jgi:uncharacterized membrane protein
VTFLKTTVVGGIVFLVPIIILVMILGKAFGIMSQLAAPLADWIPTDTVDGIALANLLAVVAIIALCFLAGLIARSDRVSRAVEKLESNVLLSLPGYMFIKGLMGGLAGGDGETTMKPVLASFDDARQVAFEVERISGGQVVVYIPGAPDPWSGGLFVMEQERVEPLEISMTAAVKNIRTLGRGSTQMLRKSKVG